MKEEITDIAAEPQTEQKATFDANKNYQWQANTIFNVQLSGAELNLLKQILDAHLSTPEARKAIGTFEAVKVVDEIIASQVELGTIQEAPDSPQAKG